MIEPSIFRITSECRLTGSPPKAKTRNASGLLTNLLRYFFFLAFFFFFAFFFVAFFFVAFFFVAFFFFAFFFAIILSPPFG
jgi:hypothetical protein